LSQQLFFYLGQGIGVRRPAGVVRDQAWREEGTAMKWSDAEPGADRNGLDILVYL